MPAQGRLGDKSFCSADAQAYKSCAHSVTGSIFGGSPDVLIHGKPALRVGDPGVHSGCCGPNTWVASKGSATLLINGLPAHRLGDLDAHCGGVGQLIEGGPDVFTGG